MDYIELFKQEIDSTEILALRKTFAQKFARPAFDAYRAVAQKKAFAVSENIYERQGWIVIGDEQTLSPVQQETLQQELQTFMPWRKGPFKLFGIEIDAEWRSDLKWHRILPCIDNLENKKVADVGCNNGYFLFQSALQKAALTIGFDPTYRFQQNFYYLKKHTNLNNIFFELAGFEYLHLYDGFFDVLFNLGVLYHHSDPLLLLKKSYEALKKGGQIVLDSLYIETDIKNNEEEIKNAADKSRGKMVLYPGTRYAGMRNVHFIPTVDVIKEMLKRAGFHHIEEIYRGEVTMREQRSTSWADVKNLKDVQNPLDARFTREGFPMPRRCYLIGRK